MERESESQTSLLIKYKGDPETFAGLPVSLQLVGRRFEDEKLLAILKHISEKIGLPFVQLP